MWSYCGRSFRLTLSLSIWKIVNQLWKDLLDWDSLEDCKKLETVEIHEHYRLKTKPNKLGDAVQELIKQVNKLPKLKEIFIKFYTINKVVKFLYLWSGIFDLSTFWIEYIYFLCVSVINEYIYYSYIFENGIFGKVLIILTLQETSCSFVLEVWKLFIWSYEGVIYSCEQKEYWVRRIYWGLERIECYNKIFYQYIYLIKNLNNINVYED